MDAGEVNDENIAAAVEASGGAGGAPCSGASLHARYICAELSRTTNPGSQHATLGAWGLRDGLPYLQSKLICDHCVDDVSCAPRVFRRVVSQGPQGRVVPLRGGQGKARSPVAYTAVSTRVSTCSFIVPTETATYLSPIPGQLTLILTRGKIRYRLAAPAGPSPWVYRSVSSILAPVHRTHVSGVGVRRPSIAVR